MSIVTDENNIRNVIDEFDYSTQNETYNENYRNWRKRKNNKYSFDFKKNERERVYVDGRGFIDSSYEFVEKSVLSKISHTLGMAALMWIVLDDVVLKIIIFLLDYLGFDIHTGFSGERVYGGCHEVVLTLIVFDVLKVIIPMIYLHSKFKVPKKVEVMGNMNNPSALVGAIAATLLVCVIATIPSAYSTEVGEVVSFFGANRTDVSIWNQSEFILYTIVYVLIMPILTQLLFCGAAFAVLRQFGDIFAILVTSVSAAALTQDFRTMPVIFLISLVGCCGMLTSGSIFTAFAVNVIYKMYELTLTLIENNYSDNMLIIRNMFMASIVLFSAIGLAGFKFLTRKKPLRLAHFKSPVSFLERMVYAVKSFPFSAVLLLCVTYAVMKAVM